MDDLSKIVGQLSERFIKTKEAINLPEKEKRFEILEAESLDPNLWADPDRARKVTQELSDLKKNLEEIKELTEAISTLDELAKGGELTADFEKEVAKIQKQVEKFESMSFLSGEYDGKPAIVAIHAGQGGTEAMDWASMLLRMYLKFCEKRDWEVATLDLTSGEEAGIKSVTFKVSGAYAYGYLKGEAGTHRLVRQSPFNADKLRQTSFALVEVLPELSEVDLPNIDIKEEDLDWQFFRASSQGGQNVQKVSSAVRLTHNPTGIVVTAQAERFQEQNRKNALNLLRGKLWLLEKSRAESMKKELKGEYRPASWGTQIRSYVLHPYKMVKDVRTGVESANPEGVLDGELNDFVEAEVKRVTS